MMFFALSLLSPYGQTFLPCPEILIFLVDKKDDFRIGHFFFDRAFETLIKILYNIQIPKVEAITRVF